ncbi:MAG TPA: dihydrofolate reductase [Rhizomicrobium sp.]|nr:dihydrofolate reductase [Rhizomicrobium sp.]
MSATLSLVIAMADNGAIGQHGKIPWHISADMQHFKAVTMGKPCIMGRKTWDSLPKKPLPGRKNIVVTRDSALHADGAVFAHSLDDAISLAEGDSPKEIAIIGGADIYKAALPRADRVYLTEVHETFDGDVFIPAFNALEWKETSREDHPSSKTGGPGFSFVTLERR